MTPPENAPVPEFPPATPPVSAATSAVVSTTVPAAGRVALPSLVIVDANGSDVATFLQGQLSNDLAGAGADRGCLAGYCNPKGRLLALPLVLPLSNGQSRLIVPGDIVDGLLQRLRMFVMRADVVFAVRSDLCCLGITGGGDGGALPEHGVAGLPAERLSAVLDVVSGAGVAGGAQLCRWHDAPGGENGAPAPERYLVVAPLADVADDLVNGDADWRLGDIAAGIPRIVAVTREAFVPQMVNLQLVGGLSFRKGCYPGQEIVARMQYLGKLKRHMRRFRVADDGAATNLVPGAALGAGDDTDAGRVVDAVRTPAGTELLAVVKVAVDVEQLAVGDVPLHALPLPYSLDAGDDASRVAGATTSEGDGTGSVPDDGAGAGRGAGAGPASGNPEAGS